MDLLRWSNRAAWVVAVLFSILTLPNIGHQDGGSDFTRMWCCAIAVRQSDVGDLYTSRGNRAMTRFVDDYTDAHPEETGHIRHFFLPKVQTTFTPAMLAAFSIFQSDNLLNDTLRFHRVAKQMFGLGFLVLAGALGLPGLLALPLLFLISTTSESFLWVQRWGNVECLQVGVLCITISLLKGRKPLGLFLVGTSLAAVAALKPTAFMSPVLLAVGLLMARRWADLGWCSAGAAVSVLGALIVPRLLFGTDVGWMSWLGFTKSIVNTGVAQDKSAFLAELLTHLGLPRAPDRIGNLFGTALTVSLTLFWALASSNEGKVVDSFPVDAAAVAAGGMLFLLSAPYVFGRYFLLAVPGALVALRLNPPLTRWRSVWMGVAIFAVYLSGNPHWMRGHDAFPAFGAYGGILILFAMLLTGRYVGPQAIVPIR